MVNKLNVNIKNKFYIDNYLDRTKRKCLSFRKNGYDYIVFFIVCFFVFSPEVNAQQATKGFFEKKINTANESIHIPISSVLKNLKEVGSAKFSLFFFDIYKSRLLTHTGKYQESESSLVFEITYLRNITSDDLLKKTVEQWQYLNINKNEYSDYIQWLSGLWPNISDGDILLLWVTNRKSVFYFNDRYLGEIQGNDFGPLFLSIWLSADTSQPKLRKKLLNL